MVVRRARLWSSLVSAVAMCPKSCKRLQQKIPDRGGILSAIAPSRFNVLAEVDTEYPALAPHDESIQLGRHASGHGSCLCTVQKDRHDVHKI